MGWFTRLQAVDSGKWDTTKLVTCAKLRNKGDSIVIFSTGRSNNRWIAPQKLPKETNPYETRARPLSFVGGMLSLLAQALLVGSPKAGASMMGASQTFNMSGTIVFV